MDSWPPRLGVCWLSTIALRRTIDRHSSLPDGQQEHFMKGKQKKSCEEEVGLFKYFMSLE